MNKDVIELIDTSVKIGLGALIAAISTYLITRFNHRAEARKDFFKRYIRTIEEISVAAEDYYQKWFRMATAVKGVSRGKTEKGVDPTSESWSFIRERDKELIEARNNKMTALARLRLLNIIEVAELIECTGDIEKELRDVVVFERKVPSIEFVKPIEEKMKNNRADFYRLLSSYYNEKKYTNS